MKMNKLTKVALLAIVAVSGAAISASAQTVSTSPTDLILGFQVTDGSGTGATTNLEVDLGSSALFTNTATLTLNQLVSSDLASTYGSGWATRADLTWGVAGITTTTANQFDATSTATAAQNNSSLSGPYGNIKQLVVAVGNGTPTANSSKATLVGTSTAPASGISNSWTAEENNGLGNTDFGYFTPSGSTEVNADSGVPLGSIDLYGFQEVSGRGAKPATDIGTFSLTSGGALTFTGINASQAVPEPSAYALGICAVLLFLVLKRRHSVV